MLKSRLTNDKIVNTVLNINKEEENMDEIEFIPILIKISPTEAKKLITSKM
ncbi:8758_t:CDS:2 [Funneliformis caledonium]|uniref:8758_t:CDS:1 n=1 Tax=Funneliformis caledonium TaxID=1117310 RepID=A0A9N9CSF1_9GLOM|nr:8758_t:CDS:2 [Funneliformis caledonium]